MCRLMLDMSISGALNDGDHGECRRPFALYEPKWDLIYADERGEQVETSLTGPLITVW